MAKKKKEAAVAEESIKGSMSEYLKSLTKPGDYLSGNPELLPKDLKEKHLQFASLEEAYFSGERFNKKDDRQPYTEALNKARTDYFGSLIQACEQHLKNQESTIKNKSDMKEKKEKKSEVQEKREPQLVTINGDKITHGHAFKSNVSDDWFFTAKINGVPLKAQLMDKNDAQRYFEKTITVKELMEKYYPSKLLPKVNASEFKLPQTITTANGEEQIIKFNVYKETNEAKENYGKYHFYAQVGDKKMSRVASKADLNAYFDMTSTPKEIITRTFGDKLGIKSYYEQFKLPEDAGIEAKNIQFKKNAQTNRFEISISMPDGLTTSSKEVSYEDRQAYFQHKVATKEQLAAKYLSNEIKTGLTQGMSMSQTKEKSLSMK